MKRLHYYLKFVTEQFIWNRIRTSISYLVITINVKNA